MYVYKGLGMQPHGTAFYFSPLIGTRVSIRTVNKLKCRQHISALQRGSERGHSNLRFHII